MKDRENGERLRGGVSDKDKKGQIKNMFIICFNINCTVKM